MADRAVRPTRIKTSHQPTVQQNKPIRDVSADIHVHSCRLAGTHITEYRYYPRADHILLSYTVGALGWATVRPSTDSNSLLSLSKTQALRCLQTLSSPPDGQSPSATPPAANVFRSRSNSQRGVRNPRTASVRLRCQPLSPIHSSGRGTQLATQAKENNEQ